MRANERTAVKNLSFGITDSPSALAPLPLDQHRRLSHTSSQSTMAALSALLTSPLALPLALSLLFLYICLRTIINWRSLRQFPGPLLAKSSRLWLFWQSLRARVNVAQCEALQQYGTQLRNTPTHLAFPFSDIDASLAGSPCRIGPNLLLTDDADLVRHMNAPGSKWTRSGWYDGVRLDPRYDSVFSARDEKLHADLRAKEIGAVCNLSLLST